MKICKKLLKQVINTCGIKPGNDWIKSIRDNLNKFDWRYISIYFKLSEEFIREFQDKVDWHYISSSQYLSEDFIREFQDKVDWKVIGYYQRLSKEFVIEFQDNLKDLYDDNWLNNENL